MATQDQMNEEQGQFGLAFAEPDAEKPAINEDDAFGITPEPNSAEGEEGGAAAPAVAVVIDAAPQGGEGTGENVEPTPPVSTDSNVEAPGAEVAAAPADTGSEAASAAEGDDGTDWKQKYLTLQGKYNKEVAGQAKEEAAEGETPAGEGAEISPDEAAATLAADFGDDFVKLIKAVSRGEAQAAAGESLNETNGNVRDIIADLTDTKQRLHFDRICDAHPDFMEIEESPEFQAYVSQHPELKEVCESGTARQVIAMLDDYKKSKETAGDDMGGVPPGADEAEGVRSTGLQLPEAPAQIPGDYKDAWDKF